MTRFNFEYELDELHKNMEEMGNRVEQAIDDAIYALEKQDTALAKRIVQNDRLIDDMEKSIEAKCLSLITKEQPVARDLRVVSATLKAVTDIERIGDHASEVAELVIRNGDSNLYVISDMMPQLVKEAKKMVHRSVSAFMKREIEEAREVIASDDGVDDLFNQVKETIVQSFKDEFINPDMLVDLLMIAKYMERIGDHAVNICEWEIFRETGAVDNTRLL
ncbi:MAG TPA: phosphate signaling complex protein PhoU [Lachnospiraceae bacterium]|nr:phosphate signaling complex protein PhoU [Lachnospiraceae bacterium]